MSRLRRRLAMGALLAALGLLLVQVAGARPAAAASGDVDVMEVGWDGILVQSAWNPMRISVTGGETERSVLVEAVLKNKYRRRPEDPEVVVPIAAFGQEVALPAGVTKEVTLWVPSSGNLAEVRVTAGDEVLAQAEVELQRTHRPYWPVAGVLAESPAVTRGVAEVAIPEQGLEVPIAAPVLEAGEIPPSAELMRGLTALVVQGGAPSGLTEAQRQAILDWVEQGGDLLIAGGPSLQRTLAVLPDGSLPIRVEGTVREADLNGLAAWSGADGALPAGPVARLVATGGSRLAGTAELPLAWRMRLGEGTVTVLAFDPGLEPLAGWEGLPVLLRTALEPALPALDEKDRPRYISAQPNQVQRLVGTVSNFPREAFPGWTTAAVLLGGFALVAGPVLHIALRRGDRREWVWVAVPALALLVSGALYYAGIGVGGRDVLTNVIGRVRLDPAGGRAAYDAVVGFFAPTQMRFAVQVPGDVPPPLVQVDRGYSIGYSDPSSLPDEPAYRVITGRQTRVEFAEGETGMRTVGVTRELGEEAGRIVADLTVEDGLIKGTVKNETPWFLEDAGVVIGTSVARLGDLAPGQTARVVLEPEGQIDPFGHRPVGYHYFGQPRQATGQSGSSTAPVPAKPMPPGMERLEIPREPETQRRYRLLESVTQSSGPMEGAGLPLTFIAFTREAVGSDLPSAGDHPTYHLTVIEQPLQFTFPPGPFTLPSGMMPPMVAEQSTRGFGGGRTDDISWIDLREGTITYEYRPPLPEGAEVTGVTVTTRLVGAPQPTSGPRTAPVGPNLTVVPSEPGIFWIYNYAAGRWEELPAGQEQVRVEPAAPYLGPEKQVRVQVRALPGKEVRFQVPEASVEGRMAE